ncbi:hypothetical protein C7B62_01595 [Pleurocapsa sp. CCALA 161]|uniref:hypothetical protein n=1 Tax=Pleurocapsa sp. CCALA 161 TaxID=2107688 RepID=UPI000D0805FA|nr:hypothetical protein [Pleurocapsa sp. CCALA 161]PSB12539.1 hypothetical protein C7B62_01595 [Pleurocapsa sp. CCALA 161]
MSTKKIEKYFTVQLKSQVRKILDENSSIVYVIDYLGVFCGEFLTNTIDSSNYQQIITQFDYNLKKIASMPAKSY